MLEMVGQTGELEGGGAARDNLSTQKGPKARRLD